MTTTVQEAVFLLERAEKLIKSFEEIEFKGRELKRPVLDRMVEIDKDLSALDGISGTELFINKLQYARRFIRDTLFMEGRINTIFY